jgi:hypothetical protein
MLAVHSPTWNALTRCLLLLSVVNRETYLGEELNPPLPPTARVETVSIEWRQYERIAVSGGLSRDRMIRKFCSSSAYFSATYMCVSAITIIIIQGHYFLSWMAVDYFVQVYFIFPCKFLLFLVGTYIFLIHLWLPRLLLLTVIIANIVAFFRKLAQIDLYLEGTRLETRTGYRLCWQRFFVAFLSPSKQMRT